MRITYFIGLLFLPFLISGQNLKPKLKEEVNKIDSIVSLTNRTEKNYSEGIAEGPIIYKSLLMKNGGWEAYYLYEKQNDNPPIRILYNEAGYKRYQKFEFYYQNRELIFAKLKVDFYRGKRKNKPIEKEYYYQNSKLLLETNSELKGYGEEYIKLTEKSIRQMIFQ
ncbi:hypothetical protein JM79_2126 [Gramella sp. Hel_I_59]|uniref:hypothetical protein n=1 Tax=Gramella sp. Hel_I_59 TaxID=1249978 RepID=UPI001153D2C0|nr:hypothetical protein [Gramella sp. Hel_I_59]TQI71199.1 hypothetical protein JM79_2126 [Gramella sp. Hel_I_59]